MASWTIPLFVRQGFFFTRFWKKLSCGVYHSSLVTDALAGSFVHLSSEATVKVSRSAEHCSRQSASVNCQSVLSDQSVCRGWNCSRGSVFLSRGTFSKPSLELTTILFLRTTLRKEHKSLALCHFEQLRSYWCYKYYLLILLIHSSNDLLIQSFSSLIGLIMQVFWWRGA